MAVNLSAKRATETGAINLKNADGSPMVDEQGAPATAIVYGPGSKVWQQANADKARKQAERMRKNGGKIEAALDSALPDQIDFLCRVTLRFENIEFPLPEGTTDLARAVYSDDALGFIRDHVWEQVNDWSAFTNGSGNA